MKKLRHFILISFCISFLACQDQTLDTTPDNTDDASSFEKLNVDPDFNYKTAEGFEINFSEESTDISAVYTFFLLDDSRQMIEIGKGRSIEGNLYMKITLPTSTQKIYVQRSEMGLVRGASFPISGNTLEHTFNAEEIPSNTQVFSNNTRISSGCTEKLYAVNGNGEFYWINSESGDYEATQLSDLAGGSSIACAVDRENRIVYYNTGTTLRKYDIDAQTFHVAQQGNPFNGNYPRMEYNNTNGLLYIAKNEDMYIINPLNNNVVSTIDIVGLEEPVSGGDMAISLDGTIYMCCFSGLYRLEVTGNTANATRISAENLPFQPTSMAIDRNDRLYLATNDNNSQVIEMDKFDGAWVVRETYNHKINDLGSLPCAADELDQTDSDGDGVIDIEDDYPNDDTKATDIYTPSKLGWGSYAFEDLWPRKGDYDYNDLVVNYRYTGVHNSSNELVEFKLSYQIKSLVGGYHNGFGIEIPIDASLISSVTGSKQTLGLTTLNAKGLEDGQASRSVIVVFEDAYHHTTAGNCNNQNSELLELTVVFNNPVASSSFDMTALNPFIFTNGVRSREVHLADKAPTELADPGLFQTEDDNSDANESIYYKSTENHPWAIDIIHSFKPPREGRAITLGYREFGNWAESRGVNKRDWYKDNSGYRDESKLCN
ncbi:LruC domain-containing protein [Sediminitomix flava]|uniref:LruC domain-containing protein n=1 Tax=Sediminitomix flava TaxID=379075 RepID=A0A316A1V7_SEDFL|nr:LruC domain-containing protein [Sediminitomix flava]PWJ43677.1 LruC domain-containing protein [Sediminitomix flava]